MTTGTAAMTDQPTALVRAAVEALAQRFYEPLAVADLLRDAWEGATDALARSQAPPVPPAPAYPTDPVAAYALHDETFPALEQVAAGQLSPDDLTAAALRELLARRRDGHTLLLTPRILQGPPPGPRSDFGLIVTDTSPLTVADVAPRGPARQAGLRRGQQVLTINDHPAADLRRFEAMALLDRRVDATNQIVVLDHAQKARTVMLSAAPSPLVSATILPGPFGLLRIDGFAATNAATEELRAALTSFERAGARGWIVDVRWCGGGV